MLSSGLALFGAICWGVAPIFGKLGLRQTDPATGLAARTLLAASLMGTWALATGRLFTVQQIPPRAWLMIALEGLLGTLIGDLAYYASLKWGEAGEVSLVMASAPLVTLLLAAGFMREPVTWPKALGAALIVGGVILLGWQDEERPRPPHGQPGPTPGRAASAGWDRPARRHAGRQQPPVPGGKECPASPLRPGR